MRLPVSRLSRVVPCAMLILHCVGTSVLLSQRRQTAPGSATATISELELVRCIGPTQVTSIEKARRAGRVAATDRRLTPRTGQEGGSNAPAARALASR